MFPVGTFVIYNHVFMIFMIIMYMSCTRAFDIYKTSIYRSLIRGFIYKTYYYRVGSLLTVKLYM